MNTFNQLESLLDFLSVFLTLVAVSISVAALIEAKKSRIETLQSRLILNLLHIDGSLYVSICNIGQVLAYDVHIVVQKEFRSLFENITVIAPQTAYRYELVKIRNLADCPESAIFNISYRDIYCTSKKRTETVNFNILQYSKFAASWNEPLNCFDIRQL